MAVFLDHLGPVSHYMASCGGSCLTFDASNAEWFKLDAAGLYPNGTWASTELIKSMFLQVPITMTHQWYTFR